MLSQISKQSKEQVRTAIVVLAVLCCGTSYCAIAISKVTLFIVGIPGLFAFFFWCFTYLRIPTRSSLLLPLFLISVAGFQFHLIEEYLGYYPAAISRIFNFAWTNSSFFITVCLLSGLLFLVCIGLYYKKTMAGFVAILFLMTRLAEIALFIFPFIKPQLQPSNKNAISQIVSGSFLPHMPNYYYVITKHYYFPGMYTVCLTLLPALYTLYRIWRYAILQQNRNDKTEQQE